eukprot:11464280-Prorocentrum_lima.AAC.1
MELARPSTPRGPSRPVVREWGSGNSSSACGHGALDGWADWPVRAQRPLTGHPLYGFPQGLKDTG